MDQITREYAQGNLSKKNYTLRVAGVKRFERQLTDNGYLVLKLFMNITEKEQKKRIKALSENETTRWRVSDTDISQNKNYEKYLDIYEDYLSDTDSFRSPWYIIDGSSRKWAELQALEILTESINIALQNHSQAVPIPQNVFPLKPMPALNQISLNDKTVTDSEYDARLKELQAKLRELHNNIYHKKNTGYSGL